MDTSRGDSLTEKLAYRRRAFMSGLAGLGTLAATGTTALDEYENVGSSVVHQQDDEIEGEEAVHPVFGFAAGSFDVDPPVESDHEVSLLERDGETELDAFPERYFEPTGLSIEPGGTVQFRLESGVHTVTAYHPEVGYEQRVPDGVGPISSPLLWQGSYFLYTFEEPGVYDLGCLVHGWAGTVCRVVVGEATGPGATDVPEPAYRDGHPSPANPGPPDWLAAAVFRDSALDPETILDRGTVGWDDLDPENKTFPRRLLTPPQAGRSLLVSLSGDQAGVDTAASGSVHLTPVENGLLWHLVLEDAECITQAHVLEGTRGEGGPVVAPMVTYTEEADGTGEGDPVSTVPDEPIVEGGVIDDTALAEAILDDPSAYYVNVHTTHNPEGEIRGQLRGGHPDDIVEREPEPAEFTVSNLNPEDVTVERSEVISISATVGNEGDITATQTVEFRIDGVTEAEQETELGCRESTTVTFEDIDTADLDPGEYEHSIVADDEVSGALSVVEDGDDATDPVADDPDDEPPDDTDDDSEEEPGPAEFVVSNLDPETLVVDPFEQFEVSAILENVGGEEGVQTVELRVGDDVLASQERELDVDQSETVTFDDVDAGGLEYGGHEFGIYTDDSEATGTMLVVGSVDPSFIIREMEPTDVTVAMDEDFEVTATIENLGGESAETVAEFLGPDGTMDTATITLGAGESETYILTGTSTFTPPGEHRFLLFLVSDTAEGRLVVEGFAAFGLNPETATVTQGDPLDVTATIENFGAQDTQAIELRVGGDVIDSTPVSLGRNDSETVTFEGVDTTDIEPGRHGYGVFTESGSPSYGEVGARETLTVEEREPDDDPPDDDPPDDDLPDDEPPDDDPSDDDPPDDEPPDDDPSDDDPPDDELPDDDPSDDDPPDGDPLDDEPSDDDPPDDEPSDDDPPDDEPSDDDSPDDESPNDAS